MFADHYQSYIILRDVVILEIYDLMKVTESYVVPKHMPNRFASGKVLRKITYRGIVPEPDPQVYVVTDEGKARLEEFVLTDLMFIYATLNNIVTHY